MIALSLTLLAAVLIAAVYAARDVALRILAQRQRSAEALELDERMGALETQLTVVRLRADDAHALGLKASNGLALERRRS